MVKEGRPQLPQMLELCTAFNIQSHCVTAKLGFISL